MLLPLTVSHLELDQPSFFVSCSLKIHIGTVVCLFMQGGMYSMCKLSHSTLISYSCQTCLSVALRSVLHFKAVAAPNTF